MLSSGNWTASAAIGRYNLVFVDSAVNRTVAVTTAGTDDAIGGCQSAFAAAEAVSVNESGYTYTVASAAIAAGDLLMPAAAGEVATHVAAGGNKVVGRAEEAGVAGDFIYTRLYCDGLEF